MFGIPAYLIWLVIIILLAVIEASTMALVCIWFAAGAVAAMLTALIGLGVTALSLFVFGASDFIIPAMLGIVGVLTLFRKGIEKAGEAQ